MSVVVAPAVPPPPEVAHAAANLGPLGRLGRLMATHRRPVAISWLVVVVALGAFAPRVETALGVRVRQAPMRPATIRDALRAAGIS